jgi:hypothetical protein
VVVIPSASKVNLYTALAALLPAPALRLSLLGCLYMTPIQYSKLNAIYSVIMAISIAIFSFTCRISYVSIGRGTPVITSTSLPWNVSIINSRSHFVSGLPSIIVSIKGVIIIPLLLRSPLYYMCILPIGKIAWYHINICEDVIILDGSMTVIGSSRLWIGIEREGCMFSELLWIFFQTSIIFHIW